MSANKRTKSSRMRGSHTHGWGAMKKRRGAGNRGGRGNAGTGKRADQNKPSIWAKGRISGKYGFTSKSSVQVRAVNIAYIDDNIESLVSQKKAVQEKEGYRLNLKSLGYTKLLGKGKTKHKYLITAGAASQKAISKVERAGGQITME